MVTNVEGLNTLFGADEQFLLLSGEEVTSNSRNPDLHVHVNALGPQHVVEAQKGPDALQTLQKDIDAVNAAGGLAQINHPNFFWQLKADQIAGTQGATLLEIMNAHPGVNNWGAGPAAPGAEEIWDAVLSRGLHIWGVASDDSHGFKDPWSHGVPRPGQAWIMVRADKLTRDNIMAAIRRGDFYASTGVELKDLVVNSKEIRVQVRTMDGSQTKYRIQFIGEGGRVLQDSIGDNASYRIRGTEKYVRARITDSNGRQAWTQPVFVKP